MSTNKRTLFDKIVNVFMILALIASIIGFTILVVSPRDRAGIWGMSRNYYIDKYSHVQRLIYLGDENNIRTRKYVYGELYLITYHYDRKNHLHSIRWDLADQDLLHNKSIYGYYKEYIGIQLDSIYGSPVLSDTVQDIIVTVRKTKSLINITRISDEGLMIYVFRK